MTPEERQAARARCEAATPGPWEWYKQHKLCLDIDGSTFYDDFSWLGTAGAKSWAEAKGILGIGGYEGEEGIFAPNSADEDFIAASRTDLPAALDDLDAKDAEIERLRVLLDGCFEWLMAAFQSDAHSIVRDACPEGFRLVDVAAALEGRE